MKVYVLCGGKGTRLGQPIKCLTDINGRPFMDHKLEWFGNNVEPVLVVGPFADQFAHYQLPMIEDTQTGIQGCLDLIPDDTWWTMGDVLCPWTFSGNYPPRQYGAMAVTRNTDKPNIAGIYLDCGIYYGKYNHRLVEIPNRPLTINTPEDLEITRATLAR